MCAHVPVASQWALYVVVHVWGWAEKFIGYDAMVEFDQNLCGLLFNILLCSLHTSYISVCKHLDSSGIEALILILEKVLNCRIWYDLTIGPIPLPSQVFFMLNMSGNWNSQMVPNQEKYGGWWTLEFKATVTHSSPLQPRTCVQEHCPGETGLPSSVFQAISKMSLEYYMDVLFKVLNYLSNAGLSGRNQCQFNTIDQEIFNLMHAKFHCHGTTPSLVSLWTFQPTLYNGHSWPVGLLPRVIFLQCSQNTIGAYHWQIHGMYECINAILYSNKYPTNIYAWPYQIYQKEYE